jgi:hypothetical protein
MVAGFSVFRCQLRVKVFMAISKPIYHRVVVRAEPDTLICLIDDLWHPVDSVTGNLDTSVLRGRYFVEPGESGPDGVAYPIVLFSDLHLTQHRLNLAQPAVGNLLCSRTEASAASSA